MKYRELLQRLQGLTPEQLEMDVTIKNATWDEYFLATDIGASDQQNGVLAANHPYIWFMS